MAYFKRAEFWHRTGTADLLASDYCYEIEMTRVMARHDAYAQWLAD